MSTKKLDQQTIDVPAGMEVFVVKVDTLKPHPLNARKHHLPTIKESLQAHGQYAPVVVWGEDKATILKGHGTVEAIQELGWATVNVTYVDVDEAEAAQIVFIDNRASDLATYDKQTLLWLAQQAQKPSRTRKIVAGVEQTDFFGTGLDIDTYETLMAEADQLSVAKLEASAAEFADHDKVDEATRVEAIKKAKAVSAVAKAQGFHEVILMYPVEQYEAFMARVKALQKHWNIESTSLTVLEMLKRTLPPTPEEVEAQFLELQEAIKEHPGQELLIAFQAGVHVRTELSQKAKEAVAV